MQFVSSQNVESWTRASQNQIKTIRLTLRLSIELKEYKTTFRNLYPLFLFISLKISIAEKDSTTLCGSLNAKQKSKLQNGYYDNLITIFERSGNV